MWFFKDDRGFIKGAFRRLRLLRHPDGQRRAPGPQKVQRLADVPAAVRGRRAGGGPGHRPGDGRRRRAEGPVGAVSFLFAFMSPYWEGLLS